MNWAAMCFATFTACTYALQPTSEDILLCPPEFCKEQMRRNRRLNFGWRSISKHFECRNSAGDRVPITRSGISADDLRQRGYHERMCDSETTGPAFRTTVVSPESTVESLCPPGFCAENLDSFFWRGTPDKSECRNSAGDRVPVTRWGVFGKAMQGINDLKKRGYHDRKCESATAAVATPASHSAAVKSDDILLCPPTFCKQEEPLDSGRGASTHAECRNSAGDRVPVTRWGLLRNPIQGLNDLRKRGFHERTCDSSKATVSVAPAITAAATRKTEPPIESQYVVRPNCEDLCYVWQTTWLNKCTWILCVLCPECKTILGKKAPRTGGKESKDKLLCPPKSCKRRKADARRLDSGLGSSSRFECRNSAGQGVPVTRWGFMESTAKRLSDLRQRGFHERECLSTTTTTTTTSPMKQCKRHCYYSTFMKDWVIKCLWKSCNGCPECLTFSGAVVTVRTTVIQRGGFVPNTVAPEQAQEQEHALAPEKTCRSFCAKRPNKWSTKCNWKSHCNGCPPCENVPSETDTASALENCHSFCFSKPETWDIKCKWKAFCNGCLQCFRPTTSATTTTKKKRKWFIPPPINPNFKWYDWHKFNITSKWRPTTRPKPRAELRAMLAKQVPKLYEEYLNESRHVEQTGHETNATLSESSASNMYADTRSTKGSSPIKFLSVISVVGSMLIVPTVALEA